MTIVIRRPHESEWPACRILLPRCFHLGSPPDAFLAWDEDRKMIAGLAAGHRLKRETIGIGVITLRAYRRQGIGSRLLRCLVELARVRGDESIRTAVNLSEHPDAEPFLLANGFQLQSRVLHSEGALEAVRPLLLGLRYRLTAAGKIPRGVTIVESRSLSAAGVLQAYREIVAPDLPGRVELAPFIVTSPTFDAAILRVEDRLAGMLIGVRNDGRGVGLLQAVAVAKEFRGGWGWANVVLLAHAADRSAAAGASRIRFEIEESNWHVMQGIERAGGMVMAIQARFLRKVAQ